MSRVKYILLGLALVALIGCSKANKENTEQQPPAVAQQPAVQPAPQQAAPAPESTPQVAAPEPSKPQPSTRRPVRAVKKAQVAQSAPPAAETGTQAESAPAPEPPQAPKVQEPRYATIPSGTTIQVRLQDPLDSSVNKNGDQFRVILDQDIDVDGTVVAPRGSILEGKVAEAARSGRVQGRASMSLELVNLIIENQSYPLQTEILSFEAESTKKKDAAKVGIGAGLGAVIGAIAGGGKGAAIGAAVGGGAGGATVLATRGKEVKLEAEHKLSFVLQRDVRLRLR